MVIMDSNASNQSNSLDSRHIDHSSKMSFHTEQTMALVTMKRNEFDVVDGHCHRCLANVRRLGVEAENKITLIHEALGTYVILRQ
jgi:hypothetical protein